MNKVVLLSAVLIQVLLVGCGNKSNNAGITPQACGAAGGPSPMCVPAPNAMNGPQGYGFYNKNGYFVPDYQGVQTGCDPGSQPILTQGSHVACVQTSSFQQFGQPVYQQDYQWNQQSQDPSQAQTQYQSQNQQYQGQNRHQMNKILGPAVECSTTNPCQSGFCQPLQSSTVAGYCRAS